MKKYLFSSILGLVSGYLAVYFYSGIEAWAGYYTADFPLFQLVPVIGFYLVTIAFYWIFRVLSARYKFRFSNYSDGVYIFFYLLPALILVIDFFNQLNQGSY